MKNSGARFVLASAALLGVLAWRLFGTSEPSGLRRLLCAEENGAAVQAFAAFSEQLGEGEGVISAFARAMP